VRQALATIARRAAKEDVVLVMLIGHGTSMDQDDARFNLVGPDLTASEWAALLRPIAARVVFVNGASGSFPFLETLAAPNRIVITANDSAQQQFETVFPGVFVAAFGPNGADLDRNGRVSVFEAFAYASAGVADHFESRGILATERPLLDDTGDGIGREADAAGRAGLAAPRAVPTPGDDGKLAENTYLQSETAIPATADPELVALLKQRAAIEGRIDSLRIAKPTLPPAQYDEQLEILLLELARIDRAIRER
jgi:hypothetical protein